jgi:hypothetical protein
MMGSQQLPDDAVVLLICGSREIKLTTDEVEDIVRKSNFTGYTHLCCGMADGVDLSAYDWALERGIPVIKKPYFRDGGTGLGGGLRNQAMVDISHYWIGVMDRVLKTGTLDCYKRAKKKHREGKLPMYLHNIGSNSLL